MIFQEAGILASLLLVLMAECASQKDQNLIPVNANMVSLEKIAKIDVRV